MKHLVMVLAIVGMLAYAGLHQARANSPPGDVAIQAPAVIVVKTVVPAVYVVHLPASMRYASVTDPGTPGKSPPVSVVQPVLYLKESTVGHDGQTAAATFGHGRAFVASKAAVTRRIKDGAHSARSGPIRL